MHKCHHCGAKLEPQQKVCPNCGARQPGGRYLKSGAAAPRKLAPLWIALALVLVLAVGVGAFLVAGNRRGEPQLNVPPTTEQTAAATTQTEPPTTEPPTTAPPATEPPTTEPAPVYRNPLNGKLLDAPFEGRVYISTISNVPDALPHVSANKADIVFESFVNYSIIRCIGLFTDISAAEQIGSIRSTRLMFNDITEHYDAILFHAGGSDQVLADARQRGIDHFSVDTWDANQAGVSVRDDYRRRNIGWEHCLLALGPEIENYAASLGYDTKGDPEKDYLLRFAEEGTPEAGEKAENITITITHKNYKKDTVLNYDPELDKYVYSQYGKVMEDGVTGEKEAYTNVIILCAEMHMDGMYQYANFVAGGKGFFACGGKLIPIQWTCAGEDQPFRFLTEEGEDLLLQEGNTYIAITQPEFTLKYE